MWRKLILLFVLAFVLRIFLINVAYHGDLNNNISWGNALLKYGTNGYYEQKAWEFSAANQPPIYIFLFGITSWIYQSIANLSWYLNGHVDIFPSAFVWFWQAHGMIILVKLPSIFADLGIGYLIYQTFARQKKRELGIKLAALWLFNPITFYNSTIWGQTDPIVNLLGLLSIIFLLRKNLVLSIVYLVISILFKGSLVIFFPIMFMVWVLQKYDLKEWIKGIILSGILIIFVSIWFHPNFDLPIWLFNLYTQRFFPGEIGYLTANAFNLWYLVNSGKVLDNVKYFGITAHTIGYVISLITAFAIIVKKRKKLTQEKTILFLLAMMALTTFLFFTRIHERYLYPFFPVATILVGLFPEFILPYVILSFTFLINMYNLFWAPSIPVFEKMMQTTNIPSILSIVNIVVFIGVFVWFIIKES